MKKLFKITSAVLALAMALQMGSAFANKKFTKEELEAKKAEHRQQKIETKAYFKEIKEGFAGADKSTKKEILAEIAKVKAEVNDDTIGVFVRGNEVDFEKYDGVKPRIENGRTIVPVRAVTESLGAEVGWDEATQTITITSGDNEIKLVIGSKKVLVNGEEKECEAAPVIENGRTLVPLRIVSESLKEKVEWDEESRTVIIEKDESQTLVLEGEITFENFDVEDYEERPYEELEQEEYEKVYEDEPLIDEVDPENPEEPDEPEDAQ